MSGPRMEADLITGVLDMRAEPDLASTLTSLDPEAFTVPGHRVIWAAFQAITTNGGLIDPWSASKTMVGLGANDLDQQLMDRYFNDSRDGLGSLDLRPRVAVVADTYRRRTIAKTMEALSSSANDLSWDEMASQLAEVVGKVSQAGNPRFSEGTDHAQEFEAFMAGRAIFPPEGRDNLTLFGIPTLDSTIMANPGRLIVIGGMPSAGKTAFAVQAGIESADIGHRVVLTSLEMAKEEIGARIIAKVAGVNSINVLRYDAMNPEETVDRAKLRPRFDAIRRNLTGLYGCAGDSWTAIEAAIMREHRRSPLKVAILDYLQLMEAPDVAKKRNDNEAQRIGEITKACKRLAQKLGINVILLSQFNRDVQEGQEPTLQNFLGSGQIERDADVALLLWNDTARGEPATMRTIHCRIAKNRGGERYGKVTMEFNPALNTFGPGKSQETFQVDRSKVGRSRV